jgi:WD40 repeat protein
MRWSPDARWVAAIDEGGAVRVWRTDTGALVQELPGHPVPRSGGLDLAFSPDSRWLASGRNARAVLLDLVENRQVELRGARDEQGFGVAFSADSKRVVISYEGVLHLWLTATGEPVQALTISGNALGVAFSPDGSQLATASNARRVQLWDLGTSMELASLDAPDELYSLRWGPSGRLAMTTLDQGMLWTPPSDRGDPAQLAEIVRCRSGQALSPAGILVGAEIPADCAK